MLNKKSIALAQTLVSNESVCVYPRQGSILAGAVSTSLPVLQSSSPSLESYGADLYQNAQVEVSGVEPHEGAVMTAVESVGAALVRQIAYVRKTVVPFISAVSAELLDSVKDSEPKEFTITQYDPSSLVYNPFVAELATKFRPKAPTFFRIQNGPEMNDVDLISKMATGIGELDDAIAETIAKYGSQTVVDLYDVLFRNKTVGGDSTVQRFLNGLVQSEGNGQASGRYTDASLVDLGIVAYFLISSFSEDPLPGTGLPLPEYTRTLNAMKLQFGWLFQSAMTWLTDASRRGTVVIRFTGGKDLVFTDQAAEIVVFGPVFRQLLSQGVTTESVIGGVIDPAGTQRTLQQFIANRDANSKRWSALELRRSQYSRNTLLTRLGSQFVPVVTQALLSVPDDQFPEGFSREAALSSLLADVKSGSAFYAGWNIDAVPDLFKLVKQKACKHLFNFIDAEPIIDIVETEMANNEISGTEAAYAAAVRYLADWLVMNFDICEFKLAETQGLVQENDVPEQVLVP